jgi:hypothetical protein
MENLVDQFKEVVKSRGWDLSNSAQSRGMCGMVSEAFATFLFERGYNPQAARLDWSEALGKRVKNAFPPRASVSPITC